MKRFVLLTLFSIISINLFAQVSNATYYDKPPIYRYGFNLHLYRDVAGFSTFGEDLYSDEEIFLSSHLASCLYFSYTNIPIWYNNSTEFSFNIGIDFLSVSIKFYPISNDALGFFIGPDFDIYFTDDTLVVSGFDLGYTHTFSDKFFLMFELGPSVSFIHPTYITFVIDVNIYIGWQIKTFMY